MGANPKLEHELKELIIKTLAIEDLTAADIDSEQTLFGDGLGLDSVDALELGVALQMNYGTVINGEEKDSRAHFANVRRLAAFVAERRQK